jgi:Domain of unknown function (DUF397)
MEDKPTGAISWKKSTASGRGSCVEVRRASEMVLVRNSKNPLGPQLAFTKPEWEAFLTGARAGEFNTDHLPE